MTNMQFSLGTELQALFSLVEGGHSLQIVGGGYRLKRLHMDGNPGSALGIPCVGPFCSRGCETFCTLASCDTMNR